MHLVWVRSDLRLRDNHALYQACQSGQSVRVLYCTTQTQWKEHGDAPAKIVFQQATYNNLAAQLAKYGISADILEGNTYKDLPELFCTYIQQHHVTDVWYIEELPFNEKRRDQWVKTALESKGVQVHALPVEAPLPYAQLVKKDGTPYQIFTPWYRVFCAHLQALPTDPLPALQSIGPALPPPRPFTWTQASFREDLWTASEKAAHTSLQDFVQHALQSYHQKRDIPNINGTSRLSPYLTSGLLSTRQCLWAVQRWGTSSWVTDAWVRELAWREFYRYLFFFFPHLACGRPFRTRGVPLSWTKKTEWVQAWKEGCTGFPIIDAGMRQLLKTGWMHNRLRMLTASFFSKLLCQEWRVGERFFMNHLIDGDFASNNGGWQWCTSTGCDASPWFRIFNPLTQSKRFDPEGIFIQRFIPELREIGSKDIHDPPAHKRSDLSYPPPIVSYKDARRAALNFYR